MAESNRVPFWWIVLFLVLTLGLGGAAILSMGGTLVNSPGVVAPLLF